MENDVFNNRRIANLEKLVFVSVITMFIGMGTTLYSINDKVIDPLTYIGLATEITGLGMICASGVAYSREDRRKYG